MLQHHNLLGRLVEPAQNVALGDPFFWSPSDWIEGEVPLADKEADRRIGVAVYEAVVRSGQ